MCEKYQGFYIFVNTANIPFFFLEVQRCINKAFIDFAPEIPASVILKYFAPPPFHFQYYAAAKHFKKLKLELLE